MDDTRENSSLTVIVIISLAWVSIHYFHQYPRSSGVIISNSSQPAGSPVLPSMIPPLISV